MKGNVPYRRFAVILGAGFCLLAASIGDAFAQIRLDRFYPPVASAGSETTVKAEGKFPTWPVTVVCDRDEINVSAAKESGVLRVVVPASADPGVAWIRVHDEQSASKLVPLLIEPIEALAEVEPNETIAEATKTVVPAVLVGRLAKRGDVDTFRFSVRPGQTIVVSATANRLLDAPMDAVLQLVDERGNVVVQSDDVRGLDPQIVHVVDTDTELYVRVFAFPETPNSTIGYAGSSSFVYELRVTVGAFIDHVLPLVRVPGHAMENRQFGWNLPPKMDIKHRRATDCSPQVAFAAESLGWQWQIRGPVGSVALFESGDSDTASHVGELPCIFSGHIGRVGEVDRLRFSVKKGTKYRATVHSREFGFGLDSLLRLVNVEDGRELTRNDDRARNQYDAVLEHSAKADGEVELEISDMLDAHGPRLAYSVVIVEPKPRVELSLDADHYVVKAGESLEISVSVSRLDGFKEKLRISAEGLPKGVQAEAVLSDIKGDSAKSVKLKLTVEKSAAYQGAFNVVGHRLDVDDNPSGAWVTAVHAVQDIIDVEDIWLTAAPSNP